MVPSRVDGEEGIEHGNSMAKYLKYALSGKNKRSNRIVKEIFFAVEFINV